MIKISGKAFREMIRWKKRSLRNILTVRKGETGEWDVLGSSVEHVQTRAEPENCVFFWLRYLQQNKC